MRVRNMINSRGNTVANQFIIETDGRETFQSYRSIIAFRDLETGEVWLDENYWNYSATTGKFRNQFLGENIADTRKKIKAGTYHLADLNS